MSAGQSRQAFESVLAKLAQEHGLDPAKVIADVVLERPAAQLLLAIIGRETAARGRPRDDVRFKEMYATISELTAKHGDAEGFKLAAEKLNISIPTARKVRNGIRDKDGVRQGGVARAHWEPLEPDEAK